MSALYDPGRFDRLVDLNQAFATAICGWLGIATEFVNSAALGVSGTKDDRLLEIVQRLDGDVYLSGPAARDYIRPSLWSDAGVELRYKDYSGYPEYPQIAEPFEPAVTVLDLLFMVGEEAPEYIWGRGRTPEAAAG